MIGKVVVGIFAVMAVANTSPDASQATQQPASVVATTTTSLPSWIVQHKETEGLIPDLRWRADAILSEGQGRIKVGPLSAKRSREQQQHMINLAASGEGAPADAIDESKHVTGEAVDFQVEAADVQLRADLCEKYGLVQTHKNESWHFEIDPSVAK